MPQTLEKIKPFHPEMIAPPNAVPHSVSPEGKMIYKEVRQRSRSKPKLDEHGNPVWRRHQTTGEPMYQIREPEPYQETLYYIMLSEGNGNIRREPYVFPTQEELDRAARAKKIADVQTSLASALVDRGLTVDDLLNFMTGNVVAAPAPVNGNNGVQVEVEVAPEQPPVDLFEFPKPLKGGWYQLSNGEKFKGKKEEVDAAEARVREAKAQAVAQPEE